MIFDEENFLKVVNKSNYAYYLGGFLFILSATSMFLIYIYNKNLENVWMVGGTELLLYLLANAISCLLVHRLSSFLKRTIFTYFLNLGLILCFIYILYGKSGFNYTEIFPIYSALVVSFFISIVLIIIIRKVLEALKQ